MFLAFHSVFCRPDLCISQYSNQYIWYSKNKIVFCRYNKLARTIRELARKITEIDPKHPFRTETSAQLLEKMWVQLKMFWHLFMYTYCRYLMGLIPTRWDLSLADKITASSFCRRRLPVVMVRSKLLQKYKLYKIAP